MYLHDSSTMFRFVLSGELTGRPVQNLEQAWTTAQSILNGKELVVDVSGLTRANEFGVDLLARMRGAGARLTAAPPRGQCARARVLRFLRLARIPGTV